MQTHNIEKSKTPVPRKSFIAVALALAALAAQTGFADTYRLKADLAGASSAVNDFSDPSNWLVNDSEVSDYPGAGDTIEMGDYNVKNTSRSERTHIGKIAVNNAYTVSDFTKQYNMLHLYASAASQTECSLTFTGAIGGSSYQYYYIYSGAKYIASVGSTLTGALWDNGPSLFTIYNGGEVNVFGSIESRHITWNVETGATLVFAPSSYQNFTSSGVTVNAGDVFNVTGGDVYFSDGLTVAGGNSAYANAINQSGGTITFGGDFTSDVTAWTYAWSGGALAITNDVSFGNNVEVVVADAASVTLDIASDSSINFGSITYGTGVNMTKTGAGDLAFDLSNMPTTLAVNEGGLLLETGDASYDISSVTFAENAKITIGATGITLSDFDSSILNAAFETSDGFSPENGATVLTCSDASVLANAQSGLNASLAGTGISLKTVGSSLVAEAHFTFNSSSVTDLNDEAGWVNGLVATAGQPATISGASTSAVMDESVPAYSAISVEDGASLTIVETRDVPAMTFAAGTALSVTSSPESVVIENRAYSGYIMDTPTFVGTMAPSRSLSEITDIVGIRGGGWFDERSNPYTYVNTKILDDGARLHAQFIYNDSDYTKCAFVDFTKDAQGNVYAIGTGAGYIAPTSEPVDFDEISYTAAPYGTSNTSGAYGVKNLTFKAPVIHGGASTVTAVGDFETTGSGSVTVDVATDCVLDLSNVDITTVTSIVKTGDGVIVFGDELPAALNVTDGLLVLQPYIEYAMGDVTLAAGADVKVVIGGEYKDAVAFVQPNGKTVYMSSGVYVGEGTWSTAENWVNSETPDASTAAHVHGVNTILTIDDASITMPASISVEGGATLRILANVALPPLYIDSASRVVFGDNATQPVVAATLNAAFAGVADASASPVALPVIEIATNATLTVASGMKFKNVDIRLYGTVTKSSDSDRSPVFGYAEDGETSYFAFTSDGGVFGFHSYTTKENGSVSIVCPAPGGTVVPVGTITLRNSVRDVTGWADYGNWEFGLNNPTNVPFGVLVDGTAIDCAANFYAAGAAHLSLVNGSCIRRNSSCLGHDFDMAMRDAATVDVGEGCNVAFTTADGLFGVDSQSAVDSICVRDGGVYAVSYNSSGWNRGVFASDGGVLGVDVIYDTRTDPRTELLLGFGSARLDGDLLVASVMNELSSSHFVNWDRHTTMANIPFSGTGDVVVTNGVPERPFTVTMVNGANEATGTIKVAKVDGDAETKLYFADGANWAGTVVAGNVALTNLVNAAAASTNAFSTLDLVENFPVRVWTDENGRVVSHDGLNVGTYVKNGGKLELVVIGEPLAEGFSLGTVGEESPLPDVQGPWTARRGQDGTLWIKPRRGMQFIVL